VADASIASQSSLCSLCLQSQHFWCSLQRHRR